MKEILLPKEEALRIAISILSGKATNKDFGSAALKEAELILKNILETEEVAREMAEKPPLPEKKPNKKHSLTPAQKKAAKAEEAYFGKILNDMKESNNQSKTILDLENKH